MHCHQAFRSSVSFTLIGPYWKLRLQLRQTACLHWALTNLILSRRLIIRNLYRDSASLTKHCWDPFLLCSCSVYYYLKRVDSKAAHGLLKVSIPDLAWVMMKLSDFICSSCPIMLPRLPSGNRRNNVPSITPGIAHLPHPWLPILTLKPNMRMSVRMLCSGGSLLSASIYLTCPPARVNCVYTNMQVGTELVSRVCVDSPFQDHLGIHAWCIEAQPFSFCVKPTGFLCLCGSQSKPRQVRQEQAG